VHSLDVASAMGKLFDNVHSEHVDALGASVTERKLLLDSVRALMFQVRRTNCSPFAIIGLFYWLDDGQDGHGHGDLTMFQKLVADGAVVPSRFLHLFHPTWRSTWTELALGLYGVMHHQGFSRREDAVGFTRDPKAVVADGLAYVVRLREVAKEMMVRAEFRKSKRSKELAAKCAAFAIYHRVVRHFSQEEVHELNKSRPADNQLTWDPKTLLLVGHCCYPECPEFLKTSMSRFRLFNHFARDRDLGNCVAKFHEIAVEVLRGHPGILFPVFVGLVKACVGFDKVKNVPLLHEHLASLFKAYTGTEAAVVFFFLIFFAMCVTPQHNSFSNGCRVGVERTAAC
jgi:hypothetical protein